MIAKEELRIGNLVIYEKTTHIVCEITRCGIASWWVKDGKPVIDRMPKDASGVMEESPCFDVADNYEPIPLTEEWLKRLGFYKRFNNDDCNLHDLKDYSELTKSAKNRGQGFICLADFIEKHGFYLDLQSRTTLKYVHELQNLFWCLAGEELNFQK